MTQRFRAGAKVFQNFIVSHIPVGFSPPGVPLYAGLFLGLHRRVSLRARGLNRFHFFSPQFIKNATFAAATLPDVPTLNPVKAETASTVIEPVSSAI